MYTKQDLDEVLSQVQQEFEKALGSINKSEEEIEVEEETEEVELAKSEEETEEVSEEENEYETIDELYSSMTKSEMEAHYASIKKVLFGEALEKSEETKTEEVKMNKSEVEAIKAENEELKKNLDNVTELLNKMFETTKKAPAQKAITGMTYVAKSEESKEEGIDISKLSKSEITNKLKGLDYGTLSKSDKDAINSFYLNNGSVEKIKHLIIE
jgi:hypothetical protein